MNDEYETVRGLVSRIRNARYGEIMSYVEALIETGSWREFTTPNGGHYKFEANEFDYFLAAEELDPTTIRHAYSFAPHDKALRLAEITGHGNAGGRRDAGEVADLFSSPVYAGSGARIRAWVGAKTAVVTERTALKAAGRPRREHCWKVTWADDRPKAEVIAAKLLANPDLAEKVFKIMRASFDHKRRSET